MIARIGAAVIAALLMVSVLPERVEAKVCSTEFVQAIGKLKRTMITARGSARLAWKRKARELYGRKFDSWWRSAEKGYGCWSSNKRERCRIRARPCRGGSL